MRVLQEAHRYKYFVEFENETTRWVSDPIASCGGSDENENAASVIGGNRTEVQPVAWRLLPRDLIIHETHLDDFTSEFRGSKAPVDAYLFIIQQTGQGYLIIYFMLTEVLFKLSRMSIMF